MSDELARLRAIALQAGWRFETNAEGVEVFIPPDPSVPAAPIPRIAESPPPANLPSDVTQLPDGTYARILSEPDPVTGGTNTIQTLVCEDCWESIPPYVDFPRGLVSPESMTTSGDGTKVKHVPMKTDVPSIGLWPQPKVVCLPCYRKAFARVYPTAKKLPELRDEILVKRPAGQLDVVPDEVFIEAPK